ncbi:DNA sulfur modification protein DndB [Paracoccaceae bacterium]|nr:DNA sulfur modification protein DndB [Paracoccaceae bacterium]
MTESIYEYSYAFPAVKGMQANKEYFASMVLLELIPKIFLFDEEDVPTELRAQRHLNSGRIPEMTTYIIENRESYVFSALTASIEGEATFVPSGEDASQRNNGILHVDMSSKFLINDGQHRRAAIEKALRMDPSLSKETIAVVFFLNKDLNTNQQMFADLNRYAVKPSKSMGLMYDHRDPDIEITRQVVNKIKFFRESVEKEKTSIAPKSKRLFTFSSIYAANKQLINGAQIQEIEKYNTIYSFWETLGETIPEWLMVSNNSIKAEEVREDYIHTHGVTLQALARAGASLIQIEKYGWQEKVKNLRKVDWRRSADIWQGRTIENGRLRNSTRNIALTSNAIKVFLELELTNEEKKLETSFLVEIK